MSDGRVEIPVASFEESTMEMQMPENQLPPSPPAKELEADPDNVSPGSDEESPLLFVDINLGPDKIERIVVYEGEGAEELAAKFSELHNLSKEMEKKLCQLLDNEISGLLE